MNTLKDSVKILVTRNIPEKGIIMMREEGLDVTVWDEDRPMTPAELVAAAKNHTALLTTTTEKITPEFLATCSHLHIISEFGVGYDNIDVAAATKLGIIIGNSPGAMSNATADVAFGLLINVSRKMFHTHKEILRGNWTYFRPTANLGFELNGKTLGIFGMGRIGMEFARKCQGAYDMPVLYYNRTTNIEAEKKFNARHVNFNELLEKSDIISVHCALTPETRGIFNKEAFSKMKKSAVFINTSRGLVHNEADLIDALEKGEIWGAGLDVTNPEPMHPDNILLNMSNVAVLPHIGSATVEARDEMSRLSASNIIAFYRNEKIPHQVDQ